MRFCLAFLLTVSAFAGTPNRILEMAPTRFEPRPGGWVARGLNHSIGFTDRATILHINDRVVRMTLAGSNSRSKLRGSEPQVASNYFIGRDYSSVAAFSRLHRKAIYPGIDVVYYGKGGELEYDFEIAPGANPSAIRMRFDGADRVSLNDRGEIVMTLGEGEIVQRKPAVYQKKVSGEIVSVASQYAIDSRGDVRVELAAYDRAKPLVIDPVLNFSAFLYGSQTDTGIAVAHDAQGNIYLAGNTWSADFPTSPDGYQLAYGTNQDVWVMKLNPALGGGAIVYCTFLGGSSADAVKGMAVDSNGVIYIGGSTDSSNYPNVNGFQTAIASNSHGFVSVLDTTQPGTAGLIYSTFLGGSNFEEVDAVAVANGKVYVTGFTTSDDFPLLNPTQSARVAGYDGFVSEFDPTQAGSGSLVFSTYLGGSGQDLPHAIAADAAGSIYVAGITYSTDGFPLTPLAYQPFYNGDGDGFLTVLNPSLGTISYSTMLGGAFTDDVKSIVIEPSGHVALAGFTLSPDFPKSQGAVQTTFKGACTSDPAPACVGTAFLTILDLKGTSPLVEGLVYSTYFGGSGGDVALSMVRDAAGRYILGGYTYSLDFPVTPDAISTSSGGFGPDGFIAIIDPTKPPFTPQQLVYSTFVTGPGEQAVYGVDVDGAGNILATGIATSNIFPNGAQNSNPGKMSGFVMTLSPQ